MSATRRRFFKLLSLSMAALGFTPTVPAIPRTKQIVTKATHEEMIGLRCCFCGRHYEVIGEVDEGEEYMGQFITNRWRNKFWIRPVSGPQAPVMICISFGFKDSSQIDLASKRQGEYFYRV